MGSFIEINDTLRITRTQGFPRELKLKEHLNKPFKAEDFAGRVFEFHNKPKIRIYKIPPVRNFLVEDIDSKWLYWGHIHILELHHDNIGDTTSGKFKITYIYTPEEMKVARSLVHRDPGTDYFEV